MSTTVKWGLITGMVYVAISLVNNLLGLQEPGNAGSAGLGMLISFTTFLITFLTIYLGVKEYKNEDLGGYLTTTQGFKAGLKMAFIAGIIAAVFSFIYMQFIDPGLMERIMAAQEEQFEEIPEDRRKMMENIMGIFSNPIFLAFFTVIWITLWGMVKGLVAGLILKKDPPVTIPPVEVS